MLKPLHNCTHFTHYKVMLKILQAMLQQYVNHELPDLQREVTTEKERQLKKKKKPLQKQV